MNKRRLQPLEGTPHKKRKTNVHLDPWSSEEQSEVDMCSIEEEMMPMIHKVPIEILTLILDLCAWYVPTTLFSDGLSGRIKFA